MKINFKVGTLVDVTRQDNDIFNNDFTGYITAIGETGMVIVKDQDDNEWCCGLNQISISEDN